LEDGVGEVEVRAGVSGSVWKVEVEVGAKISEDDTLLVLESMKMEVPVAAPCAGTVASIQVAEGDSVLDGQTLILISP
jgi:biotin carboxyl carrier protein